MAPIDPKVLAKGSNYIGLLRVAELAQPGIRPLIVQHLSGELASAIAYGQIVAVGWYPVQWYSELHAAIARAFGSGPELARRLGREAALEDFKTLHRLVLSMLTAQTVFGQAHRIMGLYWKGGEIELLGVSSQRGALRFAGWTGFSRLVWEDLMGSVEAVVGLCAARDVSCRALGAIDDTSGIDLEVRWA